MGLFQVAKPKSAGKLMISHKDSRLADTVIETLSHMADMAGSTLGPGGRQVLIERGEMNLPPIMTKDGVTVIKNLGYHDPLQQLILESARGAAIRTASEAGDGTTTATILASSIARSVRDSVRENIKISPQKMIRAMQSQVPVIHQLIEDLSIMPDAENFDDILLRVAELSANGDTELAEKIMESYDLVGDEGNLTIVEKIGPSSYELERIHGYTVDRGYEESLKKFANGFMNDKSGTMVGMKDPCVLLYDGVLTSIHNLLSSLNAIVDAMDKRNIKDQYILIVAHGFADGVLGDLHVNWNTPNTPFVLPLVTPESAIRNWRTQFLYDLQAYANVPVYNPIDNPLSKMNPGKLLDDCLVSVVECQRYKTSIIANEDPELLESRVDTLKEQLKNPESEYEANDLRVRIGKLTSGIARLYVNGPSDAETRERRDRAEDAWMAIKGAVKEGASPAGGWVWLRAAGLMQSLSVSLKDTDIVQSNACAALAKALVTPIVKLYDNYGYSSEEIGKAIADLGSNEDQTFDISTQTWVPKFELLDSTSALKQAVENSVSIASLLGTIGGVVVFDRDTETDSKEQSFARGFEKATEE